MTDNSVGIWFAEDYDEDELGDCWNCGGEGFVYGCSWDWQCDTYDAGEGTCLCSRACDVCHPRKPDPELQRVLAEALSAAAEPCMKPGCEHPRGTVCTHTLCHGRGYGQHLYAQGMSARKGENSRSEVEGEARQPGPAKQDAPDTSPIPTNQGRTR